MIRLAIRDDDMNFFTKLEDIKSIYEDFKDFPISFAVIPHVLDVSTSGACSDTRGNCTPKNIAENKELVCWLKERLRDGGCDVLLHGINHSYKILNGKRYAEMQWRDGENELFKKIKKDKEQLSNLFDHPILCFVAPSNKITKDCLKQVAEAGLNFSGIIPLKPNVSITFKNIMNYFKRWWVRLIYRLPYPGVLNYSDHKEVNACILQSYNYLVRMYNFCESHNLPMVINVHYWHLRDNPNELEMLKSFVYDYAIPRGAIPSKLSELFNV